MFPLQDKGDRFFYISTPKNPLLPHPWENYFIVWVHKNKIHIFAQWSITKYLQEKSSN